MPTQRSRSSAPRDSRGRPADAAPSEGADEVESDDDGAPEPADEEVGEEAIVEEDDDEDDVGDDDSDDDSDDDGDEDEVEVEVEKPAARVAARPSPGRPPGAKDEPEPPFFIGERVVLVSNTRPRTGSPIADHPVGATGRVETVLSQTAIVRFDRAPDVKEVVAFTCLDSLDDEAKARRAERDRQAAKG